jgi:mRNA interferase MazF
VTTPEGSQSGLNRTSAVICTNLFTVTQARIRKVIRSLPASLMTKVDGCLKAALGLP